MARDWRLKSRVHYFPGSVHHKSSDETVITQLEAWKLEADCNGFGLDYCRGALVLPDRVLNRPTYFISENNQLVGFSQADLDARLADIVFPTLVSAQVANAAKNKIVMTFSEDLNPAFVPAIAAAAAALKTVTSVEVSGNTMTYTVNSDYANGNVITASYTVPATNKLQDLHGNYVATFLTRPVTNNVA